MGQMMAHCKTKALLEYYDALLPNFPQDGRILEVGVFEGGSLSLWRKYFPAGRIFGLDRDLSQITDQNLRIFATLLRCDQNDAAVMQRAANAVKMDGGMLDVVIDDGAHTALATLNTWEAFWPVLKPGGAYCIEDWGTGYWPRWPDGSLAEVPIIGKEEGNIFRSHQAGMVGLMKQFMDEVASIDVYGVNGHNAHNAHNAPRGVTISEMLITNGYVQMRKA